MKQRKWKSAEQKRQYMEQLEAWEQLKRKWGPTGVRSSAKKDLTQTFSYKLPAGRSTNNHIKSLDTGSGSCAKQETKVYTGSNMKGIGTLHKSNAVPIFSDEEAKDQANMRR